MVSLVSLLALTAAALAAIALAAAALAAVATQIKQSARADRVRERDGRRRSEAHGVVRGALALFLPSSAATSGWFTGTGSTALMIATLAISVTPASATFSCISTGGKVHGANYGSRYQFQGASTALDGLVVFAPYQADCVGTFNPDTSVFTCVDIDTSDPNTHGSAMNNQKFDGAATAASNGLIVFAPYRA